MGAGSGIGGWGHLPFRRIFCKKSGGKKFDGFDQRPAKTRPAKTTRGPNARWKSTPEFATACCTNSLGAQYPAHGSCTDSPDAIWEISGLFAYLHFRAPVQHFADAVCEIGSRFSAEEAADGVGRGGAAK